MSGGYTIKKTEEKKGGNFYIGSLSMFFIFLSFINYYVLNIYRMPFQLETVIFMMPFTLSGMLIHKFIEKIKKVKLFYGIILIIIGFITSVFWNQHVDYVSSSYGSLSIFYLSAAVSISGWAIACTKIDWNVPSYIGRNTLPILLMHKFPIVFFQIFLLSLLEKEYVGTVIALVIASISCALCLIVSYPIKRHFPFMLGLKKRSNAE